MTILSFLSKLIKTILPFLKEAVEKEVNKLPESTKHQLIEVSRVVQAVKLYLKSDKTVTQEELEQASGMAIDEVYTYLETYYKEKGIKVTGVDTLELIAKEIEPLTETGEKGFWSNMANVLSAVVAKVDWQMLLLGVGEFIFREFVKGKVRL